MPVRIKIEGMSELVAEAKDIAANQVPYALAVSLTRTVQDAQSAIRDELPRRFTIRQARFMRDNIRIAPASKSDNPPIASVEDTGGPEGQILSDMILQEDSGEKLPRYAHFICVPLEGAKRNSSGRVPAGKSPKEVMESGMGFIRNHVMYMRGKHFKRPKKYGRNWGPTVVMDTARDKITPMYALVPEAMIPARYGFAELVAVVAQNMWEPEFEKAFLQAVKTAK